MRIYTCALLLLVLVGCTDSDIKPNENVRPIAWVSVSASPINQRRAISGLVAPIETADLSFEVNGKVKTVHVNLGSEVKKGEVLASLDSRSFELAVQSSRAEVDKAKATLAEAENEYHRYEKMIHQQLVSQSEFDNAKASYESSKSAVDVTLAKLDIAEKDLQDSMLTAPYNGTISKRLIEPSQQIASGIQAFEIEGEHGFEIQVMVPETLIHIVKQNDILQVIVPSINSKKMNGKITEIGSRAESANAFPVTIAIQNNHVKLRAGMTAEVQFEYEGIGRTGVTGSVVIIPISALVADLNQKISVFVFDQQAQVIRKQEVKTENIIGNNVYISTGLSEGDIIASAGVAFLRDGQKVTLLDKSIQRFN